MSARLIQGSQIAAQIRTEIRQQAEQLQAQRGIVPGLVTILAGEDPASQSYVRAKQKTAGELGFHSLQEILPADIREDELLELVGRYNRDPAVHGILVQLPLPGAIEESRILYAIDPDKDVDGFHPVNVGRMVIGKPAFLPCTPYGIQQMLVRCGIPTEGADVVIVGRSNIVGKPIANILLQKAAGANATVTVCHTRTRDLAAHTRRADILIVAAGRPRAITAEMVKPGAVVIDVGVNEIGRTEQGKRRLVGDVDFDAVREVASAITPVPGGVGPMTITMLMLNTLQAAQRSAS
ncbi:MAG: bifunctional methylenetetrahydrofolate dehydrogenase/methenyltetrahydrofolate cyclohydrolase [Sedimentisphaerales bacterium]|nr:bifunctional methylenetetrahydrofolate dehydrogenase/methenyltetrahydrofolate cyclohydrolase [Sedimentisphaerales bacterium]